jgi:flavin-dependent dehydrogenase
METSITTTALRRALPVKRSLDTVHVLIVGAGSAGCAAALELLSGGYHVLILERASLPRRKTCSGILVRAAQSYFSDVDIPPWVLEEPSQLDLVYQDWESGNERRVDKAFWNTSRSRLDAWMLDRVRQLGGVVMEQTEVEAISPSDDGVRVQARGPSGGCAYEASWLLGCDGVFSSARAFLNVPRPPRWIAFRQLAAGPRLREALFVFDERITPGYCWLIPKSDGLELGCTAPGNAKIDRFHHFRAALEQRLRSVLGAGKIEAYPIFRPDHPNQIRFGSGRILLCGEAAGMIAPSSAEGISYALISGQAAGKALVENGDVLNGYERACSALIDRLESKLEKAERITTCAGRTPYFDSGKGSAAGSGK